MERKQRREGGGLTLLNASFPPLFSSTTQVLLLPQIFSLDIALTERKKWSTNKISGSKGF